MACSYSPLLPADRDWVRFLIGDTDAPLGCFFQDEELDAVIAETLLVSGGPNLGTKYCAASLAWDNLIARLGSERGEEGTVGPIIEKVVGRLRLVFGGGRDNTLQEALASYSRYLKGRCAQLASARPVWLKSIAKILPPCPTVVKSSGEGGS